MFRSTNSAEKYEMHRTTPRRGRSPSVLRRVTEQRGRRGGARDSQRNVVVLEQRLNLTLSDRAERDPGLREGEVERFCRAPMSDRERGRELKPSSHRRLVLPRSGDLLPQPALELPPHPRSSREGSSSPRCRTVRARAQDRSRPRIPAPPGPGRRRLPGAEASRENSSTRTTLPFSRGSEIRVTGSKPGLRARSAARPGGRRAR